MFAGIVAADFNVTNLQPCSNYNSSVVGVNALGVSSPAPSANQTLVADCPNVPETLSVANPIPGNTYSLVSFANTSLCMGVSRSLWGMPPLTTFTPIFNLTMLTCVDLATNQQFVYATNQQFMYAESDPPNSRVLGALSCNATRPLQVLFAKTTPSYLFAYNTGTLQITTCAGAFCLQSGGALASQVTLQACAGSTPTQQWEFGVPVYPLAWS